MNEVATSPTPLETIAPLSVVDPQKFIHTLVHELRNPLTNIHLALAVIGTLTKDPEVKPYLDMICRNTEKIDDIVSQFLHPDRLNEKNAEKHSFQSILDEVLEQNEDRISLRQVILRKNYSTHDLKIPMSRVKVKIALANIIINAIEALPAKNGSIEISTRLLNGVYYIVIRDNGSGISSENLEKIFLPHFTTKARGMGLGLSGSLAILNSNDIKVNVRSDPGNGTRFLLSCTAT
jgi:signal transduction histidine kinase